MKYDSSIEFPNKKGYTPCTKAYAAVRSQIDYLSNYGQISMDNMSPEDYQTYNTLLAQADEMLMDGHVGKSVRY
jgi:hypothetical protein